MRRSYVAPLFLAVLAIHFGRAAQAADPLPTQAEIQQLFNEQKYPDVLQRLGRVLILKGDAAKPYNRHALLRLKGETHLRMKATTPATQAFDDASKAAPDPIAAAEDYAMTLLIRRSPGLQFTTKSRDPSTRPAPMDILDPVARRAALLAMFQEELAAVEPRVKMARDSKQLAGVMTALPAVRAMRSLEMAATKTDEQTRKMVADLATHSYNMIEDALRTMQRRVEDIDKIANEVVEYDIFVPDPINPGQIRRERRWRKRGLDQPQKNALRDILATSGKIPQACVELTQAFGEITKDFQPMRAEAERVNRRAEGVASADYSASYRR